MTDLLKGHAGRQFRVLEICERQMFAESQRYSSSSICILSLRCLTFKPLFFSAFALAGTSFHIPNVYFEKSSDTYIFYPFSLEQFPKTSIVLL